MNVSTYADPLYGIMLSCGHSWNLVLWPVVDAALVLLLGARDLADQDGACRYNTADGKHAGCNRHRSAWCIYPDEDKDCSEETRQRDPSVGSHRRGYSYLERVIPESTGVDRSIMT